MAKHPDELLIDLYHLNGEIVVHELHEQGLALKAGRTLGEVLASLEICKCTKFAHLIREEAGALSRIQESCPEATRGFLLHPTATSRRAPRLETPMKSLKLIASLLLIPPLGWIAAIRLNTTGPRLASSTRPMHGNSPRWLGHMGDVVSSHLRGDPVGGGCPPR